MTRLRSLALTLVCSLATICTASASSISIFNTGENAGGTALTPGQPDSHYALIEAPSGVPLTAIATSPSPAWTHNTSTADWISPSGSSTGWPAGTYEYQTTFSLTGLDPGTAELSGSWTSDNNACIYLNGVNTNDCVGFSAFGSLTAFSITSGFDAGINTLDFVVTNGGGPTGVFAEISGTASSLLSSVPEPPSLPTLMGIALVAVAGVLRRTRKRRP